MSPSPGSWNTSRGRRFGSRKIKDRPSFLVRRDHGFSDDAVDRSDEIDRLPRRDSRRGLQ